MERSVTLIHDLDIRGRTNHRVCHRIQRSLILDRTMNLEEGVDIYYAVYYSEELEYGI